MTPDAFVERLWRERAVAILRASDTDAAAAAMEAAVRGGFAVVEFTLTTPGALDLVADFARRDGLVVGAGTVLTAAEARAAVRAGARFLVSPVLDEEVAAEARGLGVAFVPGVHTPSEMWRAYRAGAPLQKLFPAPAGGPDWVRALLGPLPMLRIVPTSGVDAGNAAAYLEAGAFAVGFGGALFDAADLAARRWERVEARARALRAVVETVDRPRAV